MADRGPCPWRSRSRSPRRCRSRCGAAARCVAAFLGTLPWFVPTDGYVAVGYVAVFVLFYSAAAYATSLPKVIALSAYAVALGLFGAWRDGTETSASTSAR